MPLLCVTDTIEQSPARFLHHIQHVFKSLASPEVGVGYFLGLCESFAELHEQAKLVAVLRGAFPLEQRQIGPVHREDVMEILEIFFFYATGTQSARIVAAAQGCPLRSLIRRFAAVKIMRAGRIDVNGPFKTRFPDLTPEYGFCRGGTADIAHAYK